MPALGGAGLERKIASFGYYPRWSPNSSRILFQTRGFGLSCEFYIVGLDGNAPRPVQTDLTNRMWAISAAWHPDGKRISVWTWENEACGNADILDGPDRGRPGDKDRDRAGNPKDGGGYRGERNQRLGGFGFQVFVGTFRNGHLL